MTDDHTRVRKLARHFVCAALIAAAWIGVLAWAAGLDWRTSLVARQGLALPTRTFQIAVGNGVASEDDVTVESAVDGGALEVANIGVHAADFQILRYAFEKFPRTLELSFVFRRSDAPDEIQTIPLAWPGDGEKSVDLRNFPAWRGEISDLGFAQFATEQLVPTSAPFQPFRLRAASLSTLSWSGALQALWSDWFGYAPWSLAAVNSLGRGLHQAYPPLLICIAIGAVLSLLVAALALRWRRQQFAAATIVVFVGSWITLDGVWLRDLHTKHDVAEILYAGKPWDERMPIAPSDDLVFAAARTRAWLSTQPPGQKIFVAADTAYQYFRLIYLLLPYNAAALFYIGDASVPPGTAILLFGQNRQWKYYPELGLLNGRDKSHRVEPVFNEGGVRVFRALGSAP